MIWIWTKSGWIETSSAHSRWTKRIESRTRWYRSSAQFEARHRASRRSFIEEKEIRFVYSLEYERLQSGLFSSLSCVWVCFSYRGSLGPRPVSGPVCPNRGWSGPTSEPPPGPPMPGIAGPNPGLRRKSSEGKVMFVFSNRSIYGSGTKTASLLCCSLP